MKNRSILSLIFFALSISISLGQTNDPCNCIYDRTNCRNGALTRYAQVVCDPPSDACEDLAFRRFKADLINCDLRYEDCVNGCVADTDPIFGGSHSADGSKPCPAF